MPSAAGDHLVASTQVIAAGLASPFVALRGGCAVPAMLAVLGKRGASRVIPISCGLSDLHCD